jgi:hypothetical protein
MVCAAEDTVVPGAERVKDFAKLGQPDERWSFIGGMDPDLGFRPITLREIYDGVAAIRVDAPLPEEVATQFETARDLFVYVWFSFNFFIPAQLQALATLELALRHRLKVSHTGRAGLAKLLWRALSESVLTEADLRDAGVPHPLTKKDWEQSAAHGGVLKAWTTYAERAVSFLSGFRNELGHGNRLLFPTSLKVLQVVAVLLDKLFRVSA